LSDCCRALKSCCGGTKISLRKARVEACFATLRLVPGLRSLRGKARKESRGSNGLARLTASLNAVTLLQAAKQLSVNLCDRVCSSAT